MGMFLEFAVIFAICVFMVALVIVILRLEAHGDQGRTRHPSRSEKDDEPVGKR